MSKRRVRSLMRKAKVDEVPLAHCRTIEEFNAELAKLSDVQLVAAWAATQGARVTRLSDDELLRELDDARREEEHDNDTNDGPTVAVG